MTSLTQRLARHWSTLTLLGLIVLALPASGKELTEHAQAFEIMLKEKVMPYWHDSALDSKYGGYRLADYVGKTDQTDQATSKQLVTQSRMVWGFSRAHQRDWSSDTRNYLEAARNGYQFLLNHFRDPEHGGFYWKTDLQGNVTDDRKILYGNAFALYGFVEFYRASRQRSALQNAIRLYQTIQAHAHDQEHGGWIEHFERDWEPIRDPDSGAPVEVPGLKSANTHLHLMEAFTELYAETGSAYVRDSLKESLYLNRRYFYPESPGESCFHRKPNWDPVPRPDSQGLSYGHNVEFAWLMIHAQKVLSQPRDWEHFQAHLNHALRYGYDHDLGGTYHRGVDNEPATEKDKVWWVQAEMVAALTEAVQHRPIDRYRKALKQQVQFIRRHQIAPEDGIWLDRVSKNGESQTPAKAHNWKANYHDVRAMLKFINAFEENAR